MDKLSEAEWERWKRGVKGDTRVLGEGFLGTEPGARNQDKLGHRPRKPKPWRLGFLEPAGEREKPQRFPACEETAWAWENVAAVPTDPLPTCSRVFRYSLAPESTFQNFRRSKPYALFTITFGRHSTKLLSSSKNLSHRFFIIR